MAGLRAGMAANRASGGAEARRCRPGISASAESLAPIFLTNNLNKFGITQIHLALQLRPHAGQIHAGPDVIDVSSHSGLRAIAKLRHQPPQMQPGRRRTAAQHVAAAAGPDVFG